MVAKEPAESDVSRSTASLPSPMIKDEYIGGIVGVGIGWRAFDSGSAIVATAVGMSLVLA